MLGKIARELHVGIDYLTGAADWYPLTIRVPGQKSPVQVQLTDGPHAEVTIPLVPPFGSAAEHLVVTWLRLANWRSFLLEGTQETDTDLAPGEAKAFTEAMLAALAIIVKPGPRIRASSVTTLQKLLNL